MRKHLSIKVFGRVQGIFFRATTKEQADKFNLAGFARNEPNGSVYIEAEGEEEKLDKFVKWCYKGPSMAEVEKVEITEDKLKNFLQFEVY